MEARAQDDKPGVWRGGWRDRQGLSSEGAACQVRSWSFAWVAVGSHGVFKQGYDMVTSFFLLNIKMQPECMYSMVYFHLVSEFFPSQYI